MIGKKFSKIKKYWYYIFRYKNEELNEIIEGYGLSSSLDSSICISAIVQDIKDKNNWTSFPYITFYSEISENESNRLDNQRRGEQN